MTRSSLLCLLTLTALLAACGDTSPTPQNPQPPPGGSDTTAPQLDSSLPATGAENVPINSSLTFIFSEAIEQSSLRVSPSPPLNLSPPIWDEASTSVTFANEELAASTPYTLNLSATDLAGNPLPPTSLSFTTATTADTTAPSTPAGLVATPGDGTVTLTWQANPEADIAGYRVSWGNNPGAQGSSAFVTTSSKTVTGLNNGTAYFFTVAAQDAAANLSDSTAPMSATPAANVSDTTPPGLQASDPANEDTNVPPRNLKIKLVFSEPMDTGSFDLTFSPPAPFPASQPLHPAATTPFTVGWSESDTVATLTLTPPQELLLDDTTFTLTLSGKDKAGNALTGDKVIRFTTGKDPTSKEGPRLVSSTPAAGTTALPVEVFKIDLAFSEPMDTTTFRVDPLLEPVDISYYSQGWILMWHDNDSAVTLTTSSIPGYFLEDTTYTLKLTGTNKAGTALQNTSISFKTVDDATPPTVTSTSPTNGTTARPLTPLDVFIYFDDVMDVEATIAAMSSSTPLSCQWQQSFSHSTGDKAFGSFFSCRSDTEAFQTGTTYTITVSTGAKDTSGNTLATPYTVSFSTVTLATTGSLSLDISGAPAGRAKVTVSGPNGYSSGSLSSSTTFSDLAPGDYTVSAQGFSTGLPNKPTCRIYFPEPASQTETVVAGQTATASVTYTSESCALDAP